MGYAALKLDRDQRQQLIDAFPPQYPKIICDHITLGMMGKKAAISRYYSQPTSIEVIGIADDGNGLQVLVAALDGTNIRSHDGKIMHITHSLDPAKKAPAAFDIFAKPGKEKEKPYKPVTSNGLLKQLFNDSGKPITPVDTKWTYQKLPVALQIHAVPVYVEEDIITPLISNETQPPISQSNLKP